MNVIVNFVGFVDRPDMDITVFLPGLKGGKVLIWEKGTFVRGLSF